MADQILGQNPLTLQPARGVGYGSGERGAKGPKWIPYGVNESNMYVCSEYNRRQLLHSFLHASSKSA